MNMSSTSSHSTVPSSTHGISKLSQSNHSASPNPRLSGLTNRLAFASPSVQGTPQPNSLKLDKDVAKFTTLLHNTLPGASLKFLKDNWRTVFFHNDRNEQHVEYVLKACLKNLPQNTLEVLLKDKSKFAEAFIKKASTTAMVSNNIVEEILAHATVKQIVDHASESVIEELRSGFATISSSTVKAGIKTQYTEDDAIVFKKLQTMPAQKIVNMLAAANRLGYQPDDIVDDENVVPNLPVGDVGHPPPPPHSQQLNGQAFPPGRDALSDEQMRNANLMHNANRQFTQPDFCPASYVGSGGYKCPHCGHNFGPNLAGMSHVSLSSRPGFNVC